MQLIKEVEIAYFRSFYKETLYRCQDLNIIFGKNDVGKSNIIRALNLFFNEETDRDIGFKFDIDFSDKRKDESINSSSVRKFVYVKVTFNTPKNYTRSLGREFYVKRQWTVSRDDEYVEEISSNIKENQKHIVTRFMNQIKFIHIPAIKDNRTFSRLLGDIHEILSSSADFLVAVEDFAGKVQSSTSELFSLVPKEITYQSKISAPSRMDQLFETLDFETIDADTRAAKSLTLQRGDGIKVRHIPEILNFISNKDHYQFHIWGFEEPENSLDFASAEAEAARFLKLTRNNRIQIFVTTHSPSFYNLEGNDIQKYYVKRDAERQATIVQGRQLDKVDIADAVGEGFYLPAVAKALEGYSIREAESAAFREQIDVFKQAIAEFTQPVLLTEGRTDELILAEAWKRVGKGKIPFKIKCCDVTDGRNGGAAGASRLALSLKAVPYDNPNVVIGLFDRDEAGCREWKLDGNFIGSDLFSDVKSAMHGKAYAILLPAPLFRQECAKNENFPIEFMFTDNYLEIEISGSQLKLRPIEASRKLGDRIVRVPIGDETQFKQIVEASKIGFAKTVVPKLPDEAFSGFRELFSLIEGILGKASVH